MVLNLTIRFLKAHIWIKTCSERDWKIKPAFLHQVRMIFRNVIIYYGNISRIRFIPHINMMLNILRQKLHIEYEKYLLQCLETFKILLDFVERQEGFLKKT